MHSLSIAESNYEDKANLNAMLKNVGYLHPNKITNTLQGSIWRSIQANSNKSVVIKVTNRKLHSKSMIILNGKKCEVNENILTEKRILKYLSRDRNCPKSIVKYIHCFKSNLNYYLIMEDGGYSLFDFVVKAHQLLSVGHFDIAEWHKMVQNIFKQMIDCIDYIHSKNVCHFDISLENFLINDVDVHSKDGSLHFLSETVQIKLCDFGLAETFGKKSNYKSKKYCGKPNYKSPEISAKKKDFNAKSNDIWCLGVCLFMMIIGTSPWRTTNNKDEAFQIIMAGDMEKLLLFWNRTHYVNHDILHLFESIFKYEEKRCNLEQIKQCQWLNK